MLTEKELALIHAVGINVNEHDHPALFKYLCGLLGKRITING
jgi:hypothetical protein